MHRLDAVLPFIEQIVLDLVSDLSYLIPQIAALGFVEGLNTAAAILFAVSRLGELGQFRQHLLDVIGVLLENVGDVVTEQAPSNNPKSVSSSCC